MKTTCLVVLLTFTSVANGQGWIFYKNFNKRLLDDAASQPKVEDDGVVANGAAQSDVKKEVLKHLDKNNDGFVQLNEIAEEISVQIKGLNPTNTKLVKIFNKADANGDGKLNLSELDAFTFDNPVTLLQAFIQDYLNDDDYDVYKNAGSKEKMSDFS